MMNNTISLLLKNLTPKTLAHIAVDLEAKLEEWTHYPEDAPSENERETINQILTLALEVGVKQGQHDNLDFQHLLEQVRDEQYDADWFDQQGEQAQQNWLKDYE